MALVSRIFRLLALVPLFLGLASCATNPVSGTPDLVFMSEAQKISLGRQNEAELAAVLGHEIGHVTARHGVNQYTRAMTAQIGAGILSQVVPGLGNQIGQELINVIGNALLSGYGREDELQADRLGAEYITRNGYDPEAVIGVVSILKNQEEFEKKRAAAENPAPRG